MRVRHVIDESRAMIAVDSRDVEDPDVALPESSWNDFVDFLEAGQDHPPKRSASSMRWRGTISPAS
jgi:hypothetical protein